MARKNKPKVEESRPKPKFEAAGAENKVSDIREEDARLDEEFDYKGTASPYKAPEMGIEAEPVLDLEGTRVDDPDLIAKVGGGKPRTTRLVIKSWGEAFCRTHPDPAYWVTRVHRHQGQHGGQILHFRQRDGSRRG